MCALTVQCPAHDVRYDSSGVILSPGWPESYPNLQMCSWSVTVEKGYNVTISVESFHTEREFDVLEIFDGNQRGNKTMHSLPEIITDSFFFLFVGFVWFFCSPVLQARRPTVLLWLHSAATCPRPLTSPPPATSSWSAGRRTTAPTRKASKFAMLVSTKVCIQLYFYYYYII